MSIVFAVPDHLWVDSEDGAAVRIAMTASVAGRLTGERAEVVEERAEVDGYIDVAFNGSGEDQLGPFGWCGYQGESSHSKPTEICLRDAS
jgi:hypothetical protein